MGVVDVQVPPCCLVITGMPGAGKSTVSRLVAEQVPRSARIDGDDLNAMIISGRVWALGEPAEEAERQVELCNRNLASLARNFADAGFIPVIDWVVPDREQLDFILRLLDPLPVRFVVLAPGAECCRERNTGRNPQEQFHFDGYEVLAQQMQQELGDVGWWLDTADLTAAASAGLVVRESADRATLTWPAI